MSRNKYFANKNIPRNKKPLKNIEYWIEVKKVNRSKDAPISEQYITENDTFLTLRWRYQGERNWCFDGLVTKEKIKGLLTNKQYSDFCQNKRFRFIKQRRFDKSNIVKS